ncbi:hypothetical protein QUA81_32835 [Microcoleus sp. F6_B4]
MNIKLYVPLGCVALLSIGVAPSVAAETAVGDLIESDRSRSVTTVPIEHNSESEKLPQHQPDSVVEGKPETTVEANSLITGENLETEQTLAGKDRPSNRELVQNISDNNFQQPQEELTQNISDKDDRNTSFANSAVAAPPSTPTTEIPKVGDIEQPRTSAEGLLRPSLASFRGLSNTVQISQSIVQVTAVRLNATASKG